MKQSFNDFKQSCRSMVEQKLFAAEHGPIDVLNDGAALGGTCVVQHFEDFCFLGLSRKPRERAEIGVLDDVLVGCIVVEQFGKPTVVGGEFLVDRIAIGNVQD